MRINSTLLLTMLFILASSVHAEESSRSALLTPKAAAERVAERQEVREEKRTELKADLQGKREEARERFEERREEFKLKLETIRDEKKQAIVERTDERLSSLNERLTDRLMSHLTQISVVLDRVENKAAETQDSTVSDAITVARAAIESAMSAIEEQASKEYVITIGTEATLRTAVQATVEEFRNDMKETADTVKTAREKTAEAARTLEAAQL